MPYLHHAVLAALGGDGQAIELARQADGEVADVDHLLDLAQALRGDLADLDRDQPAERLLVGAQLLAEQPHELTALRRRDLPPFQKGGVRLVDLDGRLRGADLVHASGDLAGDRGPRDQRAALMPAGLDAEPGKQCVHFVGERCDGTGRRIGHGKRPLNGGCEELSRSARG